MAQILDKLNIGDIASFDVYPKDYLGNQFRQCVVLAILDADSVRYLGIEPETEHVKVYDSLPAGTPNDATKYQWLKLRLTNGDITAIGIPWIKADTITTTTTSTITVVYENVSPADVQRIRTMNANNGYSTFTIDIKNGSTGT